MGRAPLVAAGGALVLDHLVAPDWVAALRAEARAARGAGYALAILALGEFGQIGIRQTLYLNAFLLVEMAKVAVRVVLSPSATSLRPLPIGDHAASYLASRINLIVGVVGYGQLLIVPIINSNVSFAAGRAVSALIAVLVLGFAIWMVLRNRKAVTA